MLLRVTQTVPAFDLAEGVDGEGEFSIVHWPVAAGFFPYSSNIHAVGGSGHLVIYDAEGLCVVAFAGFDEMSLHSLQKRRLFLTERSGDTFVHHAVEWDGATSSQIDLSFLH